MSTIKRSRRTNRCWRMMKVRPYVDVLYMECIILYSCNTILCKAAVQYINCLLRLLPAHSCIIIDCIAAHALCFVLYWTTATADEEMSKGSNEDVDGSNDYGEDLIEVRLGWQRWWWGLQTAPMMIHPMDEEKRTLNMRMRMKTGMNRRRKVRTVHTIYSFHFWYHYGIFICIAYN